MDVKNKIKAKALETGLTHIGFARAERLPEAPLLEWLRRGYHGTMAWMEREPESRVDPRKIFPDCRTVIVVSLNYYTPFPTKAKDDHGRISRYAWGRDYHKIMRKKLKKLMTCIQEILPDAKMKLCSDSSPLLEKAWAVQAGIGWQGKHSNLISRDYGSWLFLGEILVDVDIEPDPPHVDFCGSCTRCMEACPTQAIIEPRVVDASRCIAYLTIEAKEPASKELAEKSGDWIFGCDICQEVCPWNKFASTSNEQDFFPRSENQKPLQSWISLNEEEFRQEFEGTPFMRPKHAHMIENAKNACRNLGLPGDFDVSAGLNLQNSVGAGLVSGNLKNACAID